MDLKASGLDEADLAVAAGNLSAATGGAAPHHAWRMMAELADAAGPGGAPDEPAAAGEARVIAALEAAMALAPRDPLEGMLVTQMTAVHAAAMRCLGRAAACAEDPKIEALYLREAARLLHLFQRQAETLDRRARRLGRLAEAGDAGDAVSDAEAQALLEAAVDAVRADLRAHRRARATPRTEARDRESDIRAGDPPIPEA